MKTLFTFYLNMLKIGVGAVLALAVLVPHIVQLAEQRFGKAAFETKGAGWLTSHPIIAFYFLLWEWFVRRHLWRIWYPKLDFSGVWRGRSNYTKCHVGKGITPDTREHEAIIYQDCLAIRIDTTGGNSNEKFSRWKSVAGNIDEAGKFVYAYEVHYNLVEGKGLPTAPDHVYGYEEVEAVRPFGKRGRPEKLNGTFYQCAMGQSPVYSGTVEFWREKSAKAVPLSVPPLDQPSTGEKSAQASEVVPHD